MDIQKTLERLKKQATLTDRQRAEIFSIDILMSNDQEQAEAELIRFGLRHPELKVFVHNHK